MTGWYGAERNGSATYILRCRTAAFDPAVSAGHPSGVQGALYSPSGTPRPVRDLRRPHTV
ncbi:MAG: hypothetical protein OXC62_16360 [Aestuariivita sp.]|nr:hypothetical protein [Aestuariivita sp.]